MDDAIAGSDRVSYSKQILPELLKRELGVVDYVDDRGGKTAHGITQRTADRLGIDIDSIDHLAAMDIYRVEYYERPGFDKFYDQRIQWRLTVDGLHSGPRTVIRRLQMLINLHELKTGFSIVTDGIIGNQTRAGFSSILTENYKAFEARGFDEPMNRAMWDICEQMKALQYGLYHQICINDETQMKWWFGWLNRIRFEPDFYREIPSIYS